MNYYFIIAQIFGILCFFFSIANTVANKKEKVLFYNNLANIASSVQYALLGAFSGALSLIAVLPRNLVFVRYKKGKIPVVFLLLFITISIAVSFMSYDGLISLLPIINIITYTYSIWQPDIKIIKMTVIFNSILELIYGLYYMAYITCMASIVYIVVGTYSYSKWIKKQSYLLIKEIK